jgi:hypothetical protein
LAGEVAQSLESAERTIGAGGSQRRRRLRQADEARVSALGDLVCAEQLGQKREQLDERNAGITVVAAGPFRSMRGNARAQRVGKVSIGRFIEFLHGRTSQKMIS